MHSDTSAPAQLLLARATVCKYDPSALTETGFLFTVSPSGPSSADLLGGLGARLISVTDCVADRNAEEDQLIWVSPAS